MKIQMSKCALALFYSKISYLKIRQSVECGEVGGVAVDGEVK